MYEGRELGKMFSSFQFNSFNFSQTEVIYFVLK